MLTEATLNAPEVYYPLVVEVCDVCFLAQVDEHKAATEIFDSDYTYFSSFSKSWLEHAGLFHNIPRCCTRLIALSCF